MSNFEQDCQRLVEIFNKTQSGNTQQIRQAEQELKQIETKDGFIPFLLNFLALDQIKDDNNGCSPRLAASIRLKNLIKFRWKENISNNDKETIRNGIFSQCIKQKNVSVRRQLFTTISYLIECDYPSKWNDLLSSIASCIQTNNPYMILGGLSILLSVYKKYHFVNRGHRNNPIEKMIDDTWPTLSNILSVSLDLYNNKLTQQNGKLNHELNILLQILKIIYRIFFVSIFMQFPKHLRNCGIFEKWLNLFLKFFTIKPPKDLQLPKSNKSIGIDTLYSIKSHSKYYSCPYVKARKWAVRCITRILQLYGRPQYVLNTDLKPFATIFLDKYALKFMELFYFGIIRQHIGDQYVYFKTLSPAITYLNLCIHYGKLFNLLLENNSKYLDNLLFTCMFRVIRLTAKDLSIWNDNPMEFIENSFRFGISTSTHIDESYDPRMSALRFIQDIVRIRSRYTFDKLLSFSQDLIQSSHDVMVKLSNNQNGNNIDINNPKYLDIMINKDAVLCILGHLSSTLRIAKNEQYVSSLKDLIIKHVIPDFQSPYGFLRARACWLIGKYWKLSFNENEWKIVGRSIITSLNDNELPVQIEASSGLSKIVLEKSGYLINFIKPQIPAILARYLEIMNDIGTESVVQTFDTLIDRLDQDIIPFATDLLKKMMDMFSTFHINIEKYVKSHPEEYIDFQLPSGDKYNQNGVLNVNYNRSEEQQKEELKQFDDNLASAMQCLRAIHTILFSSTSLPQLLCKLEEIIQPLINKLFLDDGYLYYQFYKEEILDYIQLFTYYMNPLSIYLWKILPKILEGYCLNLYSDQFNRIIQCTVNYIRAAYLNKLPFENFINQNYMDIILTFSETAIHDDNINILMFTSLFENILCYFKLPQCANYLNINKYIPRILEMSMTKYSNSNLKPSIQGAMLSIVSLIAYNNPTLFIQLLEQNKPPQTITILNILMTNYQDLMWPQQKSMVFGLSSLLLIEKQNIPQSLGEKFADIIDVTSKSVIFMNWEDGEDDDDDDDDDDDNVADDDNDNDNDDNVVADDDDADDAKLTTDDDDDDDDEPDPNEAHKLLDIKASDDYIDESDIKYMTQCCDMENNPEWVDMLLNDWDDNSTIVPRSLLDEENEVIYFNKCLEIFNKKYPQIFNKWKSTLNAVNNKLLQKYLKESQNNMQDYEKRKVVNEKEKAQRKQMAINAIDAAKQIQQVQQQQQQQQQQQSTNNNSNNNSNGNQMNFNNNSNNNNNFNNNNNMMNNNMQNGNH